MGILKDKTCPLCRAEDALHICGWTGAVNCAECLETVRFLGREEFVVLRANVEALVEELKLGDKAQGREEKKDDIKSDSDVYDD